MTTDRELLELAAKAAGIEIHDWKNRGDKLGWCALVLGSKYSEWNPITDDGDALRLAVKLSLSIRFDSLLDGDLAVDVGGEWEGAPEAMFETYQHDGSTATRRAIVRAAAEIGRGMK